MIWVGPQIGPMSRWLPDRSSRRFPARPRPSRVATSLVPVALGLAAVPTASAHDVAGHGPLTQAHGIGLVGVGVAAVLGAVALKRTGRIAPTVAVYAVLAGLAVTAVGAIVFDGLAPDATFSATTMPFPRIWYPYLALAIGLAIATASVVVGYHRWPDRPRYAVFGMLMGVWVSYPYLLGPASDTHPLGYLLVLAAPALVGYIVWRDAWPTLRTVVRDPVARHFGIGVGLLVGLFFLSMSGYLSFFWEEGVPRETAVAVLPVNYQLVMWPTLEVALPQVPLFFAVSVGVVTIVGMLSGLVGLNAAVIARHWRLEEAAGMTEGTAGTAAIVGTCTCGCCGPLVAKVAILAAGPSIAAPLYWVFVDSASPLGVLFIVGSLGLFTASLVYSIGSARRSGPIEPVAAAD